MISCLKSVLVAGPSAIGTAPTVAAESIQPKSPLGRGWPSERRPGVDPLRNSPLGRGAGVGASKRSRSFVDISNDPTFHTSHGARWIQPQPLSGWGKGSSYPGACWTGQITCDSDRTLPRLTTLRCFWLTRSVGTEQCYPCAVSIIWVPTRSGCPLNRITLSNHHGVAPRETVNKRGLPLIQVMLITARHHSARAIFQHHSFCT